MTRTVVILLDRWNEEYRVPGPSGSEAQAYYTNDREDALGTARVVWGSTVSIRIKRVDDFADHVRT